MVLRNVIRNRMRTAAGIFAAAMGAALLSSGFMMLQGSIYLAVPRSALFRGSGSQWQLFAVRDGRANIRDVRIGLMNDRVAEVVEGLEPGDTVIVAPETSLANGAKVSLQTQ